eukprot:1148832-Pelagomonas_calceolata.AAC.3
MACTFGWTAQTLLGHAFRDLAPIARTLALDLLLQFTGTMFLDGRTSAHTGCAATPVQLHKLE